MRNLTVTSPSFREGDWIPLEHTARGRDISPELCLDGIDQRAVSLAVTMDDASHPLFPNYNHWVIWNLPVLPEIPAAIPPGEGVGALSGAVQGVAYGKNRYKGPKPPFRLTHRYVFTVFVLDCGVSLPPGSRRSDLFSRMEGHILQTATLSGWFQSRRT